MRVRSLLLALLAILACTGAAYAQSQAINGTIEGIVRDTSAAVLPGVTVTVTNQDTGLQRVVVTDGTGTSRAAILPIGTYRIKAELQGFKTMERGGVALSAGLTAVINFERTARISMSATSGTCATCRPIASSLLRSGDRANDPEVHGSLGARCSVRSRCEVRRSRFASLRAAPRTGTAHPAPGTPHPEPGTRHLAPVFVQTVTTQ